MWEAGMNGYGGGGSRGVGGGLADDVSQFAIQSSFPALDIVDSSTSSTNPTPSGMKTSTSRATAQHDRAAASLEARVVLMHSPPFQDAPNADRPGSLFRSFLHPVIVIVSDVGGADDMQFSADRALRLTPEDKAYIDFKTIYCTPITPLKVQKVLNKILDDELDAYYRSMSQYRGRYGSGGGVRVASSGPSLRAPRRPSPEEVEGIADSCCGDLRHAIIQLQFICHQEFAMARDPSIKAGSVAAGPSLNALLGSGPASNRVVALHTGLVNPSMKRDASYSSLHGVAKLLHASLDNRGFMKFDPDLVMERSEFPIDMSLSFLQYNYIEFVRWDNAADPTATGLSGDKDLDQLETISNGLDLYAEASLYWDIQYSGRNILDKHSGFDRGVSELTSDFPVSYCISIASRAAALSRHRPNYDPSAYAAPGENGFGSHSIEDEDEVQDFEGADSRARVRKKQRTTSAVTKPSRGMLKVVRPLSLDLWCVA
jgi:hypothetical protein